MKKMKRVLHLLRVNGRTLAAFEIVYKILSLAVFTPVIWAAFNGIMKLTGYEYLTKENLVLFLKNPITIVALLILVVCMAVYSMIDIGGVIFILDQSSQDQKVTLLQTWKFTLKNAVRVFKPWNLLIALVVLVMIPFLNIGVASSYISTISIPEFMMDTINSDWRYRLLLWAAVVLLGFLLLRWLYSFHYFTLEGCNFRKARKKSRALSRKNKIRDLLALVIMQAVCYLLYLLFVAVGILLAFFFSRVFAENQVLSSIVSSVVYVVLAVSLILMVSLSMPISYACISVLFYFHKEKLGEEIIHSELPPGPEDNKVKKKFRIVWIVLFAAAVACCSFYVYQVSTGKASLQIEYLRTMEVTAHRGASAFYPENTMAAFEGAWELGADWIELDVQQSKDGKIFVMHDTSFKRTTGVNKSAWEMTYDEIAELDAGSSFSSAYAWEKIPLLSEVIDFAKEHQMRLNIELKPTGHEQDFEKNVVQIIEEMDFKEDCVITSQVYGVLERVKECDPEVTTVYVMSLAYGNINRLTAADYFSIEATSVSEQLVSRVHNAGKQLFAWTVNTEENINKMIRLNVDNIITDDVTLAKECIYSSKTSNVIQEYVKFLMNYR